MSAAVLYAILQSCARILRVSLRCRDRRQENSVPDEPADESEHQSNNEKVNHFEFVVVGTFDTMLVDADEKMFWSKTFKIKVIYGNDVQRIYTSCR